MLGTLNDMFQAGFDTTATTLYWITAFLVNYPQYQEELQQEIDDVVGRDRLPGKVVCQFPVIISSWVQVVTDKF